MIQLEEQLTHLGIRPLRGQYLPISDDELKCIEQILGVRLPETYREFARKFGQSTFNYDPRVTPESNPFVDVVVTALYGGRSSLDYTWDPRSVIASVEKYRWRMPKSMIPIGEAGNDLLCLGISGPDRGKVFHWDRDAEVCGEDDEKTKYDNVRLIASSFESFIQRLEVRETM